MDKITNSYQKWVREEVESPDIAKAKEAFFEKHFPQTAGPAPRSRFAVSPSLTYALVSCFALLVFVKIGSFDVGTISTHKAPSLSLRDEAKFSLSRKAALSKAESAPHVEIKKLSSQMGPTVAYQKHFSDVQVTVVWVFPKGA